MPISGLAASQTYYWRVRTVTSSTPSAWSDAWTFTVSSDGAYVKVEENSNNGDKLRVYPNPSKGELSVSYVTEAAGNIEISIYDVAGRMLSVLHSGFTQEGRHTINYSVSNYAPGVYFVTMRSKDRSFVQKLVVE